MPGRDEQMRGDGLVVEAGEADGAISRPTEDVEIDDVAFDGGAAPGKFAQGAGGCPVNAFAVAAHPAADFVERGDAGLRDSAIGHGSDVQEIIAAFADDFDEAANDDAGRFPILIEFAVAPGGVESLRSFPVFFETAGGHAVVSHILVISHEFLLVAADAAVDEALRLEGVNDAGKFGGVFGRVHAAIKPNEAERAVIGEKLAELRLGFLFEVLGEIFFGGIVIPVVAEAVGIVPIFAVRIVDGEANAGALDRRRRVLGGDRA